MDLGTAATIISLVLGFVIQTAVIVRWGVRLETQLQALRGEYDRELPALREAKHQHANLLTSVLGKIEFLEDGERLGREDRGRIFTRLDTHRDDITRVTGRVEALTDRVAAIKEAGD